MKKHVLLIAFHFPPQAASSGIQRTLSFSKYLSSYGWNPLVLSAHPRAYSQKNSSQISSIPDNIPVSRAFSLDSKRHLGINGKYPELVALPDRWITWWLGAVPAGLKLIRKYKPQVIWSTFPIATAHLIALSLHSITKLPWVADFRDPMIQPSYPTSKLQRWMYNWIERQTIFKCEVAIFTTRSAMDSYQSRYPTISKDKFVVIENGYDEEGFTFASRSSKSMTKTVGQLILVHSGVLYQTGRDPSAFLEAIANLRNAGDVSPEKLQIIFRAPGEVEAVKELADKFGVADFVQVLPPIPYSEALHEMLNADGLLVFQGKPFNNQIPAKIYEYFRTGKPIMGLIDHEGETARMLKAEGFQHIVEMTDVKLVAEVLHDFISRISCADIKVASDKLITSSSRQYRASELATVLNLVTEKKL